MVEVNYQTRSGRTKPCCREMAWALSFGHIRKGWMYQKISPPRWTNWRFQSQVGEGVDTSPIHFCPFCGHNLDISED